MDRPTRVEIHAYLVAIAPHERMVHGVDISTSEGRSKVATDLARRLDEIREFSHRRVQTEHAWNEAERASSAPTTHETSAVIRPLRTS